MTNCQKTDGKYSMYGKAQSKVMRSFTALYLMSVEALVPEFNCGWTNLADVKLTWNALKNCQLSGRKKAIAFILLTWSLGLWRMKNCQRQLVVWENADAQIFIVWQLNWVSLTKIWTRGKPFMLLNSIWEFYWVAEFIRHSIISL